MSDALINGLAGAGGGIIAQLITYPLLTVHLTIYYAPLNFVFVFPRELFLLTFAVNYQ
jgi:hypothetical protein